MENARKFDIQMKTNEIAFCFVPNKLIVIDEANHPISFMDNEI